MATVNSAHKCLGLSTLPIPGDETLLLVAAISANLPAAPTCCSHCNSSSPAGHTASISQPTNEHDVLLGDTRNLSHDSDNLVSVPFSIPHIVWNCAIDNPIFHHHLNVEALIDHGSPIVLIDQELVSHLQLHLHTLPQVFPVSGAFSKDPSVTTLILLTNWVKLKLHDHNSLYSPCTVCMLVALNLCHQIILGLPFMYHNNVIINICKGTTITADNFDLLNSAFPSVPPTPPPPPNCRD